MAALNLTLEKIDICSRLGSKGNIREDYKVKGQELWIYQGYLTAV